MKDHDSRTGSSHALRDRPPDRHVGTIQNFSHNPFRRVDLVAQLAGDADWKRVIEDLRGRVARIPNVVASPAPDVFILTFTERGPVLCVRPYCHTDHYWQVYFDTNAAIAICGGELGLPTPMASVFVTRAPAPAAAARVGEFSGAQA